MNLLKFNSIELEGFGTFQKKQTFQLDRPSGLYFIAGNNKVDPHLGSNDAGKTTLLSAVVWCLFNKTIRGLSGPKLKNWANSDQETKVSLSFSKGYESTLTRTQSPNSLVIEPSLSDTSKETLDQETLNTFLGFNYDRFLYTAISGQFNTKFLELKATDKLELFVDILNLKLWENCSKIANTKATTCEAEISKLNLKINNIQGQLFTLQVEKEKLVKLHEHFEEDKLTKISGLLSAIGQAEAGMAIHQQSLITYTGIQKRQEESLKDLEFDKSRIQENFNGIQESKFLVSNEQAALQNSKNLATNEFNTKWKTLTDKCPYCLQPIDRTFISTNKQRITKEILELNTLIQSRQEILDSLQEQYQVNADKLSEVETKYKSVELGLKKTGDTILNITKDIANRDAERQQKTQEMLNLRTSQSPYIPMIATVETQISAQEVDLASLEQELKVLNRDALGNQFWVKGFKDLRLWLISDALEAFEIESNNILPRLGMSDWAIRYEMERETTTGGLTKGFHVLVQPPGRKDDSYIPFNVWGGGVSQRLQIAATKGLSNLIKNQMGVDFNIEVWDEPSSYLSPEGIEHLIQMLYEEAQENQKVIYVIDHHNLASDLFAGTIVIEKDLEGSKIIDCI